MNGEEATGGTAAEGTTTRKAAAGTPSDDRQEGLRRSGRRSSEKTQAEAEERVAEEHDYLLFAAGLSRRYHDRLVRHYHAWSLFGGAISVVVGWGSSVVAEGTLDSWAPVAGIVMAVGTTWALVSRSAEKSAAHRELRKRFIALERFLKAEPPSAERVRQAMETRHTIEEDEPPTLKVLSRICHNEQSRSIGYGESEFLPVGPIQHLLATTFSLRLKPTENRT